MAHPDRARASIRVRRDRRRPATAGDAIVTDGLSLEQAPPLDLPLRLFLTAPLFAAAGVLLMLQADLVLATRWSPAALAATHLLTVGFLGMVMVGALPQMLPVPAVRPVATAVQAEQ